MNLFRLIQKELFFHWRGSLSALIAVTLAAGALLSTLNLLRLHETSAVNILAEKERETKARGAALREELRKATLKLSFNLLILPEQIDLKDWYADQASEYDLPETYAQTLADSGVITVRHFLPTLQRKLIWTEQRRTILLTGTRGEVANLFKNPRKPLVQPVPEGGIVLGHELHTSLGISSNDTVRLLDREFNVHRLHEERGSKDDVTVWISLRDAQELLGKEGRISSILALECLCASGVEQVREEIQTLLPGTQVVEMGSRVLARAETRIRAGEETKALLKEEARQQARLQAGRERLAAMLVPLIMVLCGVWIGLLSFTSVRSRRDEIGMLRAVGFGTGRILMIFIGKAVLIGLLGGLFGYVLGAALPAAFARGLEDLTVSDLAAGWAFTNLLQAMLAAGFLMVVAGWLPALLAAHTDPAEALREE